MRQWMSRQTKSGKTPITTASGGDLIDPRTMQPSRMLCLLAMLCIKIECRLKYSEKVEKCNSFTRRKTELKLLKLRLSNFKGFKELIIDTQGKNVNIYGDNATGKTTVFDAINWLLFDKDSLNSKDFGIKTLDAEGNSTPGVDHEVEGKFQINGDTLALKKIYKEVYTKKRGSALDEFTGHTTDYYINELPVKKSEYEAKMKSLIPENLFKLLTNPLYFNEILEWKERRKILFELCGEETSREILKTEDAKKILCSKQKKLNDELKNIPVRIDEATKSKPDVNVKDEADIQTSIENLKAKQSELRAKLSEAKSGGVVAEKKTELYKLEGKGIDESYKTKQSLLSEASEMRKKFHELSIDKSKIESELKLLEVELQEKESVRVDLRNSWTEVNATKFKIKECQSCGQSLPEEKSKELEEKFNLNKSELLSDISQKGKLLKARCEELPLKIQELKTRWTQIINESDGLTTKAAEKDFQAMNFKYEFDPRIETLKQEIKQLSESQTDGTKELEENISENESLIEGLQKNLSDISQVKTINERIEQLKQQQKTLSTEYEKLEKEVFQAEQTIKEKIELLDSDINSKFKDARFKLFETQVNDGIKEICTTTYLGVPYPNLNNAARINIGLEIISVLSEHYKYKAPVVVDNAESVTKLYKPDTQLIRLIVSEADKKLRIELED
jgi:DNA repair exonuclease SbcCD ATPase subunit